MSNLYIQKRDPYLAEYNSRSTPIEYAPCTHQRVNPHTGQCCDCYRSINVWQVCTKCNIKGEFVSISRTKSSPIEYFTCTNTTCSNFLTPMQAPEQPTPLNLKD